MKQIELGDNLSFVLIVLGITLAVVFVKVMVR